MKFMIILKAYTYICATLFTMFAYFNYDYSNLIYYHYNYLLQDVYFVSALIILIISMHTP